MFRFTLRGLAIYVAFVGLTLALTRVNHFQGSMILIIAAWWVHPHIPSRTFRFAYRAGLLGMMAGHFLLDRYVAARFAAPPPQYWKDGWYEYEKHAKPIAIQLGALIGATAGLLWERSRAAE